MTIYKAIKNIEYAFPFWGAHYLSYPYKYTEFLIREWEDIYDTFNINPNDTIMEIHPNYTKEYEKTIVVIGTPVDVLIYREDKARSERVHIEQTISKNTSNLKYANHMQIYHIAKIDAGAKV